MRTLSRLCTLLPLVLSFAGGISLSAQATEGQTKFQRALSNVDFGLQGVGEFTSSASGPIVSGIGAYNQGQIVSQTTSNTLGGFANLRYTPKAYFGLELNYTYARYTEGYSTTPFQIQTQAQEFTLGYVVQPKHPVFGFQPFASAGMGSIEFKPTAHGGQGAPVKARAAYYYNAGLQKDVLPFAGLRVGFRQVFFLDPDFGQNYLTIKQHVSTIEPYAGFYLRF